MIGLSLGSITSNFRRPTRGILLTAWKATWRKEKEAKIHSAVKQLDEGDKEDLEPKIRECDEMWTDFDNLVAKAEEDDLLSQAELRFATAVIASMLVYSSTQRPRDGLTYKKRDNTNLRVAKYPGAVPRYPTFKETLREVCSEP